VTRVTRVCVTGGLGFIGRHLCRALVARGYRVRCVDRATAAAREVAELPPGVELVGADLSIAPLDSLLEDTDAVIHLAALPGVRAAHPLQELWRHNVHATARLASALGSGRRLVLASTSSVYGNAARLPTPEDTPAAPLNPYAATKVAAEAIVLAVAAQGGADALACRLFTVFGPAQRADMAFSRWIGSIAAGRPVPWCARWDARREFTYVGDAVRGLVAALERGRPGQVYNLPGSGSIPVRSALAEIERLLGRRARLSLRPAFAEAVTTSACGAKARAELGYVPRVMLAEGLARQVEAARQAEGVIPLAEWSGSRSRSSDHLEEETYARAPRHGSVSRVQ
jgi:UDP-glucuronate 4-epimerase